MLKSLIKGLRTVSSLTQLVVDADPGVLQTSGQEQTGDAGAVAGRAVPVFQRYLLVDDRHEVHGRGHLSHGPGLHEVSRVRLVCADDQVRVLVVVQVHSAGQREAERRYRPSSGHNVLRSDQLRVPFPDARSGTVVYVHRAQLVRTVVRSTDGKICGEKKGKKTLTFCKLPLVGLR